MKDKLNPEFKEKLLTALRSGEYPKTTCILRDSVGYCCLGVAGALVGIPDEDMESGYFSSENLRADGFLGKSRGVTIKNSDKYPRAFIYGHKDALSNAVLDEIMELNDGNDTFKEVADYIEKNL